MNLLPDFYPACDQKRRLEEGEANPQQTPDQAAEGRGLQYETRSHGDRKGPRRILSNICLGSTDEISRCARDAL